MEPQLLPSNCLLVVTVGSNWQWSNGRDWERPLLGTSLRMASRLHVHRKSQHPFPAPEMRSLSVTYFTCQCGTRCADSANSKARESILSRSKPIHTYRHVCLWDAVSKGKSECLSRATLRSSDDQPNSPFTHTQKPRGDPQTQSPVCFSPNTSTGRAARGSDSTD